MSRILTKAIILFLFLSLVFRPILPAFINKMNICMTDANNSTHSFIVHLLLKNVEKEKEKFADCLQVSIYGSPLGLPKYINLYTRPFILLKSKKVVVDCCLFISNHPNPIFQPPES